MTIAALVMAGQQVIPTGRTCRDGMTVAALESDIYAMILMGKIQAASSRRRRLTRA
jgi:hypothetical protein